MSSHLFEHYQKEIILLILFAFVVLLLGSMWQGALAIEWRNIFQSDSVDHYILWHVRVPRILAGILIGGGLAISGAVMQGLFRNPLVEPGIIGVSGGAALFAAGTIVLGEHFAPTITHCLLQHVWVDG